MRLDALCDASTLNHIVRRTSCTQGATLLTLYTRGFTHPAPLPPDDDEGDNAENATENAENGASAIVAALKLCVRRGEPDPRVGRLPICWGVLTGALGMTIGDRTCSSVSFDKCVMYM